MKKYCYVIVDTKNNRELIVCRSLCYAKDYARILCEKEGYNKSQLKIIRKTNYIF